MSGAEPADEASAREGSVDEGSVDEASRWVVAAARAAADKASGATVVLEVGDVLPLAGWFVVTSGANSRQVKAIADEVERVLKEAGGPAPRAIEGLDTLQWVLMSFDDFVVHVFHDEARAFYDLERLWRDVPTLDWAPT